LTLSTQDYQKTAAVAALTDNKTTGMISVIAQYLVFHGTLNGMHSWIWLVSWEENCKPEAPSPITKMAHNADKGCYNMAVQLIFWYLCGITVTGAFNVSQLLF
jgi:hypothetical protein